MPRTRQKRLLICAILIAILSFSLAIKWNESIDIHSGKNRIDMSLFGIRLLERTNDTAFSIALKEIGYSPKRSQWRPVARHGLLDPVSPHFRMHSVPTLLDEAVVGIDERRLPEIESSPILTDILGALEREDASAISDIVQLIGKELNEERK
jgi:hypothetical protein